MALWQFKIELVPAERLRDRAQIDRAEFDTAAWWADRQPPEDYRQRLAALLPSISAWHKDLLWFGSEDADRIEVWLEQGRVESIGVRIDCRKANLPFVEGLLRITHDWACGLVELRYLEVLPTVLPELVKAIADSPSCRFMEDPAHWLPKLAAEVKAQEEGGSRTSSA